MDTTISSDEKVIAHQRWVRIIPLAVVMYILAFIDRINVAMILPYVNKSFGLTAGAIGFAAGIFFVGYMMLPIPGGLLASRWSPKKIVAILMVLWAIPAMATGLVQNLTQLYVARFVLGFFAGGVWPTVLVLLTAWFPQKERARANALWMTCLPLSAIIMTPLTGWMLTVMTWRWVFIIQGAPPLLWVVIWWLLIADRPSEASWISKEERNYIEKHLAADAAKTPPSLGYWAAITEPKVLWLLMAYFFWMAGFYGFTMWAPSVVKSFSGSGQSELVGWLSAIPFVFALVAMVVNSTWSDRRMKRQMHVAIPLILGAMGLVGGQFVGHWPLMQMICLLVAAIGVYSPFGPFWTVPSTLLHKDVAGAAMGIINLGNLGGFLGPYVVGYIRGRTHSGFAGFLVLSAFLIISAVILIFLGSDKKHADLAEAGADTIIE